LKTDDPEPEFALGRSQFEAVRTRLLTAEEMAETLDTPTLGKLKNEWEAEISDWGQAVWEKRGETIRLREERASLRSNTEMLRAFGVGDAEAARVWNDAGTQPGVVQRTKRGGTYELILALLNSRV
jgi:hypothetical protein